MCVGDWPSQQRKVLTLFLSKWVIYDKHDTWCDDTRSWWVQSFQSAPQAPNVIEKDGKLELEAETLAWYSKKAEEREKIAEEARADHGEVPFNVGDCLRSTWMVSQRADVSLVAMFHPKTKLADGYRTSTDGLLEREK